MVKFGAGLAALVASLLWPIGSAADATSVPYGVPAGIEPARISLAHLLAAYDGAEGQLAPGTEHTLIEHRTITRDGVSGAIAVTESGDDERIDETLGLSAIAYGTLAGRDWDMNANGEVVVEQGIHRADEIDHEALQRAIARHGVTSEVRLLGRISTPVDAFVVEVDPHGGVPEYLYIDSATSHLDAEVLQYPEYTERYTYDDYRTTGGLSFAWHTTISRHDARTSVTQVPGVIDERIQEARVGVQIDPYQITIPQSKSIVTFSAPRATLPGSIIDDRVVLPVQLGNRTVNLQLDSGASGILIDTGILRALGDPVTLDASVVPEMSVGPLTMRNVHVDAESFAGVAAPNTPVAGLIGFDFIDCVVLHVDYADGIVEAIDPSDFTPPPGAVTLPIALDDSMPAIAASIGPAKDLRFIVDTGADSSILFSSFGTAHADALEEGGIGAELAASWPFLSEFFAVGGSVTYRAVEVQQLSIGPWTFPSWPFNMTLDPSKFDFEDYDGLLGQDLLRYFDLYLDYPHGRIVLVPNARYTERFAT